MWQKSNAILIIDCIIQAFCNVITDLMNQNTGSDLEGWQLLNGTMVTRHHTDHGCQRNRTRILLNASTTTTTAMASKIYHAIQTITTFARKLLVIGHVSLLLVFYVAYYMYRK